MVGRRAIWFPHGLACVLATCTGLGCRQSDEVGGGEVEFNLPTAIFSVTSDPNDSRWLRVPPQGIPNQICRGNAALTDNCCHPVGFEEPIDCQQFPLSCDAAGWCALVFAYNDTADIDLGAHVPVLRERRDWVLARAELPVLKIQVTEQRRSDRPALPIESAQLYVAPQGVLSPRDPASRILASIPLVPSSTVALDPDARSALSTFLTDFNTPFTLILVAHVAIESPHTSQDDVTWQPSEETFETLSIEIDGRVQASF